MAQSLDYAKEVYAACATIGFDGEEARALKRLIDRLAGGGAGGESVAEAELLRAAQDAHRAAANWAGRRAL